MIRKLAFSIPSVLFFIALTGVFAFGQTDKPSSMDRYFPYYTAEYTSIPNITQFVSQFDKTDIGVLSATPTMKPFRDSMSRQLEEGAGRLRERLGISFDDLRNVASGEVGFGVIFPNKDMLAIALMADITGHTAEAGELVNKVCAKAEQNKGKTVRQKIVDAEFIQLDVLDKNNQYQKIVYVLDGNLMIVCDNLPIAKLLWQKASGKPEAAAVKPLAASAYYQAVYKKTITKSGAREAFIFAQIDRYLEALQLINDRYSNNKLATKSPVEGMKKSGLDAFRATGGVLQLKPANYDRFFNGYIYAPAPWTGSMNMFKLTNTACPDAPAWIGADTAMFAAIQTTPSDIYANLGPMFDTYFGEGEQGVWSDVVEGLEKDPMGPQINIQKDLVRFFDGQVLFVSHANKPYTTDSERIAYILKVKDETAVRSAIDRLFKDDPVVKPVKLGTYNIWQSFPKEKKTLGAMSTPSLKKSNKKEKPESAMAHAAIAVENGYLIIASRADYLQTLLAKPTQPMKDSAPYKRAMAELQKLNGNSASVWIYCPTDVNNQLNYELFKQGKISESKSFVGKIINGLSGLNKNNTNITIDASSLPAYEQVKPYFGPAGAYIKSEPSGFFMEGFGLSNR